MPVFTKQPLSASLGGLPILVSGTASNTAVEIHRVQATATDALELVTLWLSIAATSGTYSPRIQYDGGATVQAISAGGEGSGVFPDIDGKHGWPAIQSLPRTGTDASIEAFNPSATQEMYVWGYVDRIATG